MKKILITGANSYIGTSFETYMKEYKDYKIDTLDMQNPDWKEYDFSLYDVIFHVAGIVHQKETKKNVHLYYTVNRDLAIDVAKKAKKSKVSQFVMMSSMSVYGLDASEDLISLNTLTNPTTNYGISKLQAENEILKLKSNNFYIVILRPPMVYGNDCPGNLKKLFNVVRKLHVFPTIHNQRSSITIEKLSEFIKSLIDNNTFGIFLPQNDNYMCTYEIVKEQMKKENVKVIYLSIFNPIIKIMIGKVKLITKMFGDLKYEKQNINSNNDALYDKTVFDE